MFHSEAIRDCPVNMQTRFDELENYYIGLRHELRRPENKDHHKMIQASLKADNWIDADYENLLSTKKKLLDSIYTMLTEWHSL